MEKCSCYRTKEVFTSGDPFNLRKTTVSYCIGTKEQDVCDCYGIRAKCNFYPKIREEAKQNITVQEAINHFEYGISHDIFSEPVKTYSEMAVEALKKQNSQRDNTEFTEYEENGNIVGEDCLIATYDCYLNDATTLCVARKEGSKVKVLKQIQGDEAFGIYHYLTGGADLKNTRDIPQIVIRDGDDESDNVYCPCCKEYIGSNENVWEDFCYRNWKPIHCRECGQSMIYDL